MYHFNANFLYCYYNKVIWKNSVSYAVSIFVHFQIGKYEILYTVFIQYIVPTVHCAINMCIEGGPVRYITISVQQAYHFGTSVQNYFGTQTGQNMDHFGTSTSVHCHIYQLATIID